MDSEDARNEKLLKLIDLIKSKKADKEADRETDRNQFHEMGGDFLNKRDTPEAELTTSSTLNQVQNKKQDEKLPIIEKENELEVELEAKDIQVTKSTTVAMETSNGKETTASAASSKKTLEVKDTKHDLPAPTGKPSPPADISSKEEVKADVNEQQPNDPLYATEKEADKKDSDQDQSNNLPKQDEKAQNIYHEDARQEDKNKVDLSQNKPKSKAQSKDHEGDKMEHKKIHKAEPKHTEPKEYKEKSRGSEVYQQHSTTALDKPEQSLHPNPQPSLAAPSEGVQDNTIPNYPPKQNEINEIKEQVDEVTVEASDSNPSNEDSSDVNTAVFFEGYGIAAGHAEDEFGGLGLIGVFEEVASVGNRSINQQSYQQLNLFMFLFLVTWYMFNNHRG